MRLCKRSKKKNGRKSGGINKNKTQQGDTANLIEVGHIEVGVIFQCLWSDEAKSKHLEIEKHVQKLEDMFTQY